MSSALRRHSSAHTCGVSPSAERGRGRFLPLQRPGSAAPCRGGGGGAAGGRRSAKPDNFSDMFGVFRVYPVNHNLIIIIVYFETSTKHRRNTAR